MKTINGFVQAPHSIFETDKLTFKEKTLLLFIMERANRLGKIDKEFNISLKDLVLLGIDQKFVQRHRQKLIDLNLINYRKGIANGKSSIYCLNWEVINSLSNSGEEEEQPREDDKIEEQQESRTMGTCLGTIEELEKKSASKKRVQTTVSVPTQKSEARRNYEEYMEGPTGMDFNSQYRAIQEAMRTVDHRIPSTAQTQRSEIYKEEDFGFDEWVS
jgi:hypothetical protein